MNPLLAFPLVVMLLTSRLAAQNPPTGPELLRQAARQQTAGQLEVAAATYGKAAEAFRAAGSQNAAAAAYRQSASASESYAARLLAGAPAPAARPAAAGPAAAPAPPAGAAPVAGRLAGGKPVGLFFFVDSFNNERVYYFTPAGQVYVNPADFSVPALAALPPGQRGSYAVNGKQMTIKWANGSATTGNYHYDPTGFGCEGSFMCVAPLAGARQLAGTFEGRNAAVSVDANSLAVFRTLAFKPDGTFTRDSYAASHSESRHADNTSFTTDAAATAARQGGRWRLDGWFLTLTDARGTVRGLAFRTDWDEKTDQTLRFYFNGTSYKSVAKL